jgi:hypothetical protein
MKSVSTRSSRGLFRTFRLLWFYVFSRLFIVVGF